MIHAHPIIFGAPIFDPSTADYLRRVRAAGSSVSVRNARAIDRLIRGLKRDGLWEKLKAACLLAGPDTLSGALVPLRADMPTPTNNNFVSADYSRTTGLKGKTGGYISSGFQHNLLTLNSRHLAVFTSEPEGTASIEALAGTISDAIQMTLLSTSATGKIVRIADNSGVQSVAATATGLFGGSRSDSATKVQRYASSMFGTTAVSASFADDVIQIMARGAANHTTARLSFYSIGEALDLAQLDALLTAYMAALR
jgi:hypothetical protein